MESSISLDGLREPALDPSLVTSIITALHDPKTEKSRIPDLSRWLLEFRQLPNSLDVTLQLLQSPYTEVRFHAIGMVEFHLDKIIEAERLAAQVDPSNITSSPLPFHLLECFSLYISNKEKEMNLRKLCSLIAKYAGCLEHVGEMWIRLFVAKAIEPTLTTADLASARATPVSPEISRLVAPETLYFVICFLNELGGFLYSSIREFRNNLTNRAAEVRVGALTAIESSVRDASNIILLGLQTGHEHNGGIDSGLAEKIRTAAAESVVLWNKIGNPQSGAVDNLDPIRAELAHSLIVCISHGATPEACQYLQTIVSRTLYGMSPSVWKDVQVLLAHPDSIFRRMVKQAQLGDDEARPYFNLFLTVAEQSVQEMLREPETDFHGYLLEVMKESLSASDWPVEPSHPAILALQFWQNFIDEMSDALMADESPSEFPQSRIVWWNSARLNLLAAIEKFMIRLRLPSLSELHDWGKDERDVFREFRRDVKDLFSEAYSIIGNDILVGFVRFTASALESSSPDPLQIEASLTSFSAIGDAINESDETDQAVATIVGSRLFQFLSSPELPYLVKKSGIDLIASMTSFYQRRPDLVPLALNFLFEAAKHESLAVSASRSISQLTSACRSELTSELSTFFVKYDEFIAGPTIDSLTKEKLIGSIAAVVQAIPVHEDRLSALETLLRYVSKDIERSIELMNLAQRPGHPESARESLQAGEQAMRCLAAIARSFEDDGTQVVDLENSEGGGPMSTEREKILQLQISRMISTQLSLFGDHATFEVVESACSVFRTGFKGRDGGPFSLPAADFLALLFQRSIHSPGFSDEWLKSLCTYLSAASLQKSQQKESDMNDILEYLLNLVTVQLQNDPGQDPDATVGIVQCLSKFFRSNLAFFSRLRVDCRPILHFAARSLETREILPRRAAAEFWKQFLEYTNQPPEIQPLLDSMFDEIHSQLAVALVSQVALHSSKSELGTFAEPIGKYVQRHRNSISWMEQAIHTVLRPLVQETVYSSAAQRYLKSIQKARGSLYATKKANLEFREACRGPGLTL